MSGRRRGNNEGTLYQLPDGRWQARTPAWPGESVRTKTAGDRNKAAAWLDVQLERHPADVADRVEARLALIEEQIQLIRLDLTTMNGEQS